MLALFNLKNEEKRIKLLKIIILGSKAHFLTEFDKIQGSIT
jgi:hypothetical protein